MGQLTIDSTQIGMIQVVVSMLTVMGAVIWTVSKIRSTTTVLTASLSRLDSTLEELKVFIARLECKLEDVGNRVIRLETRQEVENEEHG